jgi:hypothetical protein
MTGGECMLLAAGLTALAVLGPVLNKWLQLRFWRHVYNRGGVSDVTTMLSACRSDTATQTGESDAPRLGRG